MNATDSGKNATFTLTDNRSGDAYELPMLSGSDGPDVIDVRKLYAETDCFTYDPGYSSTGSCESKITFIDGEKGVLLYRGYPIDQLADHSDFPEVCYLLLYGELPSPEEKAKFENGITYHTMLHEQLIYFFRGFRRDAHPMAVMCGVVGALSAFYHDSTDITDPKHRMIASYRLIAKMPTIAAMAYKFSIGAPFMYPRNDLNYAENFLYMMYANPCEEYEVNPVLSKAMDRILILHADHEQNASTSTVRLAGSSGANPFACISAGIASLWGPAHGGANEAVLNMLEEIGHPKNIAKFVEKAKDKDDPFRLMGLAIGSIKILTHALRSCEKPVTKCSMSLESRMSLCSISPSRWSVWHLKMTISSKRNCTRTSISIPVLSSKRWAFRRACLPFSLRSRERSVGSRNGMR